MYYLGQKAIENPPLPVEPDSLVKEKYEVSVRICFFYNTNIITKNHIILYSAENASSLKSYENKCIFNYLLEKHEFVY